MTNRPIERRDGEDFRAIVAFARAFPGTSYDEETLHALLQRLGGPEQIFDYWQDNTRVLTGFVLDGCANPDGASELMILGHLPGPGERAFVRLFEDAEARVIGTGRALELSLTSTLLGLRPALLSRGYVHAFTNLVMALDISALSAHAAHAASQAARDWRDLDSTIVESAYDCYREAFGDVSGSQVPGAPAFCEVMLHAHPCPSALVEDGRVAALCRVVMKDAANRLGEVRFVCRRPALRGRGLGAAALDRALAILSRIGATTAHLEVAASNHPALGLYQRRGFRVVDTIDVFRFTNP